MFESETALRQTSESATALPTNSLLDLYSHVMGKMKEAHVATIANLLKRGQRSD
jgi:hypothetical protein